MLFIKQVLPQSTSKHLKHPHHVVWETRQLRLKAKTFMEESYAQPMNIYSAPTMRQALF